MHSHPKLDAEVLAIAAPAVADTICVRLADAVKNWRRRGAVVALSGGVDSSVCAALAVQALGAARVFGLLLPERESASASAELGAAVARHLGIDYAVQDIAPTLEAIGCYRQRDQAIRRLLPAYGPEWRSKLVIAKGAGHGYTFFKLVAQSPEGRVYEQRLPHREYLEIVAATNYKQRIRKAIEYFHADRLNYAVIGTPNRLEYDQGFFVKNGDGSADVKPIAHLYKSQVYALARWFGLPDSVCSARPTTDTYSLAQGQDEFYFGLPYEQMDLALWAHNHGVGSEELAVCLGIPAAAAAAIYRDIETKRSTTRYLHARPVLVALVDEVAG